MSSFQEFLLTAHILGAVVWAGGSVALLLLGYHLKKADNKTRADFTALTEWMGPRIFAPASIAVIVAGPLLASDLELDFSEKWITIGFIGWTISFLIGVGFYNREGKNRERLIEQNGIDDAGVAKSMDKVLTVATFDTLIVLLVIVDMIIKPGV